MLHFDVEGAECIKQLFFLNPNIHIGKMGSTPAIASIRHTTVWDSFKEFASTHGLSSIQLPESILHWIYHDLEIDIHAYNTLHTGPTTNDMVQYVSTLIGIPSNIVCDNIDFD